jgi:hypothetical protein
MNVTRPERALDAAQSRERVQLDGKRRAIESGFDEHIPEPADVHDIESVLRRFPPRNSQRDASV